MNIHEHQAKEILKEYDAPVSNGVVIFSIDQIEKKIKVDSSIIRYLTVKYKKLDTKNEFFKKDNNKKK